jgi:hypothetical protein
LIRIKRLKKLPLTKVPAINLLIVISLLVVVVQDFKLRAVYWFVFPVLALLFIFRSLMNGVDAGEMALTAGYNMGFLLFVFVCVWAYFSIKNRQFVYLPDKIIGWGDILLLVAICFYFSLLNFIVFYTVSLLIIIIGWLWWTNTATRFTAHIPLAGLISFLVIISFVADFFIKGVNLTNDNWLLFLISR